MPPSLAVRDGDWKLFVNHDGSQAELYNIPRDIGEQRNVAGQHPELVKSLSDRAIAWSKSLPASPARDAARQSIAAPGGAAGKPAAVQPRLRIPKSTARRSLLVEIPIKTAACRSKNSKRGGQERGC